MRRVFLLTLQSLPELNLPILILSPHCFTEVTSHLFFTPPPATNISNVAPIEEAG